MTVHVQRQAEVLEVRIDGRLDLEHAAEAHAELQRACDGSQPVSLDLSEVERIDGAGLAVLACLADRCLQASSDIRLTAASEPVERWLALTRLDALFASAGQAT